MTRVGCTRNSRSVADEGAHSFEFKSPQRIGTYRRAVLSATGEESCASRVSAEPTSALLASVGGEPPPSNFAAALRTSRNLERVGMSRASSRLTDGLDAAVTEASRPAEPPPADSGKSRVRRMSAALSASLSRPFRRRSSDSAVSLPTVPAEAPSSDSPGNALRRVSGSV